MLNHVATQEYLQTFLESLAEDEDLPEALKVDVYAGNIDIIKLTVSAARFPAILIHWQGEKGERDYQTEERAHGIKFSLLVCTDSASGLTEGMAIVDQLNEQLPGQHADADGERLFDITIGPAKPLLNMKTKQVISYPITCSE